eukprot:9815390-Alexandrium_andersonii.AAC.1
MALKPARPLRRFGVGTVTYALACLRPLVSWRSASRALSLGDKLTRRGQQQRGSSAFSNVRRLQAA